MGSPIYDWDGKLNTMGTVPESYVNGPTETGRFVLWVQGCGLGCPNCFNPQSWANKEKTLRDPIELAQEILASGKDGLTISGGEPLSQPKALLSLLQALHVDSNHEELRPELARGIILFTGFDQAEMNEEQLACLEYVDVSIQGRFIENSRVYDGLRGSSNQNILYKANKGRGVERLKLDLTRIDQAAEVHLGEDGGLQVTGFPDIDKETLKGLGVRVVG